MDKKKNERIAREGKKDRKRRDKARNEGRQMAYLITECEFSFDKVYLREL